MPLPEWMNAHSSTCDEETLSVEDSSPRGQQLLRRAVGRLAHLLEEMLANETIARRAGLLQMVDARAKVLGLLGLLVIVTLLHSLLSLCLAYAFCLLLALLSRVPARRLAGVWLAVPIFSAGIILPAALNIVTPGHALLTLWHFSHPHFGVWSAPRRLTLTDAGLLLAGRFVLRTAVCVTLALLLTATTYANRLFRGLRALGVPVLFIMLLSMMTRYLSVFLRAAEEIHLAKISRSITLGTLRQEQAWVASGMGALSRRTHAMSQSVYLAMLSRGYTGEIYLLDDPRWRLSDWGFLMVAVGSGAALWVLG